MRLPSAAWLPPFPKSWIRHCVNALKCIILYHVIFNPVFLQNMFVSLGLLAAVGGLEAYSGQTFILLTWTPPFSLDLTGIDPDLWYCVEVYNISSGETLLTNSSTVSEPRFNFTVTSPSPCDLFEFRVIPVNGAGNGNITSVSGTFFGGGHYLIMFFHQHDHVITWTPSMSIIVYEGLLHDFCLL